MSYQKVDQRNSLVLLRLALISAFYFAAAKFGLDYKTESARFFWSPSGIALASALLYGYEIWPAIFLGSFFVNQLSGSSILTATGLSIGNTVEPLLATYLLQRFSNFETSMNRIKDVAILAFWGAILSTILGAAIGAGILWFSNSTLYNFWFTWPAWWLSDATGIMVVVPLCLVWHKEITRSQFNFWRFLEGTALMVLLAFVGSVIFKENAHVYWFFPFGVWAALRFGQLGMVTCIFVISTLGLRGTLQGTGPFAQGSPRENLFMVQSFVAVISVTGMILAAALAERNKARESLKNMLAREEEANRRFRIQYNVMALLADSPSIRYAASGILQIIGKEFDWDIGAFWLKENQTKELSCLEVWKAPTVRSSDFLKIMKTWRDSPGGSLPRRILNTGKPEWLEATTPQAASINLQIFEREGLKGAFGFPISSSKNILGVVQFFSRTIKPLDESFLQAMATTGGQIGQYMDRITAEKEMKRAIQVRDDFLSTASHELKTPLRSLKLQIQMRKRNLAQGDRSLFLPEKLEKIFMDEEKQVNRLGRLVNDMLDISRLNGGKMALVREKVNLALLIQECVDRFSPQIQAAGCSVFVCGGENIIGEWDRFRVEQVFINLLINALKYGEGQSIYIKIYAEGNAAAFSVTDQGIGIEPKDQTRIFGQFERANKDHGVSGLGLGLYIAKQIIQAHGGTIVVESEVGRGSTFVVTLPLALQMTQASG